MFSSEDWLSALQEQNEAIDQNQFYEQVEEKAKEVYKLHIIAKWIGQHNNIISDQLILAILTDNFLSESELMTIINT